MRSRGVLVPLLLLLAVAGPGCKRHIAPERPRPVTSPATVVTKAELKLAMRSVHYHTKRQRDGRRKDHRPAWRPAIVGLSDAVAILMRDPSYRAHRWRQRAVVALAASSIEENRRHLEALRAPIPQLQMLLKQTTGLSLHWIIAILRQQTVILYPWWLPFFTFPIETETPTPTATPTPTKTWTPQPPPILSLTPTPTVTITPSTIAAVGPCTTSDLTGTPILCRAPGVPDKACVAPKNGTTGTWVQAEFKFNVNRPPGFLSKVLDPQNWDTCTPDFFVGAYVLPMPSNNYSYPDRCSDVTKAPTPGQGYSTGSVWHDVLYEHFDALGAAVFKNRIEVKVATSNSTNYHYDYWLDGAVCSEYGLSEEDGGLDVDEGFIEVIGTTASSSVHAMKMLSFSDRVGPYWITGNEIDQDIYDFGTLATLGDELARVVCECVPE